MEKITIKQLEVFLAVAENGSFTVAAEKLYMTQSTVSIHIASLEEVLGVSLFQRDNKKKISMTREGRMAYSYAREILGLCKDMRKSAAGNNEDKLKIGASSVPAEFLVPEIMSDYLKECGHCSFILQKGDSTSVHDLLKSHKIQIGFVGSALSINSIDYYPILDDRLVMITPNNEYYRSLKKQGYSGEQLLKEPMIIREKDSGSRKEFEKYLLKNGHSPDKLNIVAEIEQPAAIISVVSGGMGVASVSYMAAEQAEKDGKILSFELGQGLNRDIYLAIRKNTKLSERERDFIDFVLSNKKIK